MRALAMSVLVGVQPVLTHVPPKRGRSMIATDLPAAAKARRQERSGLPTTDNNGIVFAVHLVLVSV